MTYDNDKHTQHTFIHTHHIHTVCNTKYEYDASWFPMS